MTRPHEPVTVRHRARSLVASVLFTAALAAALAVPGCRRDERAPAAGAPVGPSDARQPPGAVDHLALGAPGEARPDGSDANHYLLSRPQYVVSYNNTLGVANWVCWHLGASDLGDVERGKFQPDPDLPEDFRHITPRDYTGSGYDRGHLAPSGDRTDSEEDNRATFYMTNVVPQAAGSNQGPWKEFEDYCRELARQGNELYLAAGPYGVRERIGRGARRIAVPDATWKVAVVLPDEPGDDAARVNSRTRVIGLWIPNEDSVRDQPWQQFVVPVREIEARTGLNFLSRVPAAIRETVETRVDRG